MRTTLDRNFNPQPISSLDSSTTQILNGTSTSAQSSVFSTTKDVEVFISAEESFHIEFGTNPTSTTNSQLVAGPVNMSIFIPVGEKIAVIKAASATAGNVFITEYLD